MSMNDEILGKSRVEISHALSEIKQCLLLLENIIKPGLEHTRLYLKNLEDIGSKASLEAFSKRLENIEPYLKHVENMKSCLEEVERRLGSLKKDR